MHRKRTHNFDRCIPLDLSLVVSVDEIENESHDQKATKQTNIVGDVALE